MSKHQAVARRFAELLEHLEMDRSQFVAAVDEAVSERSLYSILNGHRRPSRSLAVLIERIWGFRAGYLLHGQSPAWTAADDSSANRSASDDEVAIHEMLAGAPELARTLRRDLDDSALWTDLWQRTNRMLEGIRVTAGDASPLGPAERTRIAFDECMLVADSFSELASARYQRRTLHLVASFVSRALEELSADDPHLEKEILKGLRQEAEAIRERLAVRERALRAALIERADAPSPLAALQALPPGAVAGKLLESRISGVLERYSFGADG